MTDVRRLSRPAGKGLYVRDHLAPLTGISDASVAMLRAIGVRFVATSFRNRITASKLESAGIYVWTFGSLNDWDPDHWKKTLRLSLLAAAASGGRRVWADTEVGWKDASPAQWAELGAALLEADRLGFQVAITTHGGLRKRLVQRLGPMLNEIGAVVSPQVMDHMTDPPASLDYAAEQVALWTHDLPGAQIVPTVGAFNEDGSETPGRFAQVFAAYPVFGAAIVWPEHKPNAAELEALRSWKCGKGVQL